MPILTTENAEIKTAAIEIKSLTVSNRQVTLSLFRQIPHEDLIDYDQMKLNGTPWGQINYFWKETYEDCKIHIVWQKGKELRRSIILRKASYNYISHGWHSDITQDIKDLGYSIATITEENYNADRDYAHLNIPNINRGIKKTNNIIELTKTNDDYVNSDERELERYNKLQQQGYNCQKDILRLEEKKKQGVFTTKDEERRKRINELQKELNDQVSLLNEATETMNSLKDERFFFHNKLQEKIKKFDALMQPLLNLPQLFIAV